MMEQRLIDANALEQIFLDENKRLSEMLREAVGEERDYIQAFAPTVEWARKVVHNSPTVDAVPVVRCGECVHKRLLSKEEMRFYDSGVLACTRQRTYNDPLVEVNHFCSYGERRDSDG